jgi:endonuclease/exonuclease/phosphatase family metal-dependent hydrolase
MKIYSWNMLYKNPDLEGAFDFIQKCKADIICLQEVPTRFLQRLKTLSYHLRHHIDVVRSLPAGAEHNYVVILSKAPIRDHGRIPCPDYWDLLPLRTRAFVRLMRPFGFTRISDRGGIYADVETSQGLVRIVNLHLILAHPAWRYDEFVFATTHLDRHQPTIMCGDFNILESPLITPLNWLLGGKLSDAFLYLRERSSVEALFHKYGFTNALRGKITHALSRSQLDHILVSHQFSITQAEVVKDAHGSDHQPIFAEVS